MDNSASDILSPRMAASQRNGRLGGLARARKLSPERRQEIGEIAGAAIVERYGHAYFRHMVERKKALKAAAA
jgi:hypothetical protein